MHETSRGHRAQIAALAKNDLAKHVLTDLGAAGDTRVFRFAQPGTNNLAVRIVLWPHFVCVAGDIGDTIFQHSDRESLAWVRGALRGEHLDYALGKVRNAHKTFMPGDAAAFIAEWRAEWQRKLDENEKPKNADLYRARIGFCDDFDPDETDANSWHTFCRSELDDDEPPECQDFAADHVWACEILRAFVVALDAAEAARADRYYILDNRHSSVVGNCGSWWRAEGQGYCCDIREAGVYTLADAKKWACRKTDEIWPAALVERLTVTHVRADTAAFYEAQKERKQLLGVATKANAASQVVTS